MRVEGPTLLGKELLAQVERMQEELARRSAIDRMCPWVERGLFAPGEIEKELAERMARARPKSPAHLRGIVFGLRRWYHEQVARRKRALHQRRQRTRAADPRAPYSKKG